MLETKSVDPVYMMDDTAGSRILRFGLDLDLSESEHSGFSAPLLYFLLAFNGFKCNKTVCI